MNDLISRSALLDELQEELDFDTPMYDEEKNKLINTGLRIAVKDVKRQPAVDAVVLPKGRPGDYLEWDNGIGYRTIHRISAILICEDFIRYELAGNLAPVVNHKSIVRIISKEEMEKEIKRRADDG